MTDAPSMTEHGIFTSVAAFWLHFMPCETLGYADGTEPAPAIYWYPRQVCARWIRRNKLPEQIARSKNAENTPSGVGYLVPKKAWFVTRLIVPPHYAAMKWHSYTDREFGTEVGPDVVRLMVEREEIRLPPLVFEPLASRQEQIAGSDFQINTSPRFELKCERPNTANLFVQKAERMHQHCFAPGGEERITPMEGYEEK